MLIHGVIYVNFYYNSLIRYDIMSWIMLLRVSLLCVVLFHIPPILRLEFHISYAMMESLTPSMDETPVFAVVQPPSPPLDHSLDDGFRDNLNDDFSEFRKGDRYESMSLMKVTSAEDEIITPRSSPPTVRPPVAILQVERPPEKETIKEPLPLEPETSAASASSISDSSSLDAKVAQPTPQSPFQQSFQEEPSPSPSVAPRRIKKRTVDISKCILRVLIHTGMIIISSSRYSHT